MAGSMIGPWHRLFNAGTVAGVSDGALLERFAAQRDGAAFEAIVARHGPAVLGVCRRVLHGSADVDDAFQATFLVLVRRAGTLRDPDGLGPWLYGVAYKVAVRARVQGARHKAREQSAAVEPEAPAGGDPDREELIAILDGELARLPRKFRETIVTCDLEGRSHEEAARAIGCPLGTVKSRLAAAREKLRGRLARRGVRVSSAALAAALAAESSSAAVPAGLADVTVSAGVHMTTGCAAGAGVVSASVTRLTEGVLMMMWLSRLKTISAIGLLLAAGTAGMVAPAAQPPADERDRIEMSLLEERIRLMKQLEERARALKQMRQAATGRLEELGAKLELEIVSVNLVATKVRDDDLASLNAFPSLQSLYLHHTQIGDTGLAHLQNLRGLTTLDLFDTKVTDAGLKHFSDWFPHLEWLTLSDTQISDEGLKGLEGLKHLRRLDVRRTKVTAAGMKALQQALPGLQFE